MIKAAFTDKIFKDGNRHFIQIPFNVWEEWNQKGLISVKASLNEHCFECRLIPKGKGFYYLPVAKRIANQIGSDEVMVSLEAISGLNRINQNSCCFKEPIQINKNIQMISYPKAGYCGQICLAILTGLRVDEIVDITHTGAWQCSMSKLIEALDTFGISHADKVTYTRGKPFSLPECCIVNVRSEPKNTLVLSYHGKFYIAMDIDFQKIIGYLKINVD